MLNINEIHPTVNITDHHIFKHFLVGVMLRYSDGIC